MLPFPQRLLGSQHLQRAEVVAGGASNIGTVYCVMASVAIGAFEAAPRRF